MLLCGTHKNKHLQNAFDKYGPESFICEIVEIVPTTEDSAADKLTRTTKETKYIQQYIDNGLHESLFNIQLLTTQTVGPWSYTPEETKEKLRKYNTGRKASEETKKKMSIALTGKVKSEEARKKLRESLKKKPLPSAEARKRISETLKRKGIKPPSRAGIKDSEETKKKRSDTMKRIGHKPPSMKGKKHSAETKKKMSKAAMGKIISAETKEKLSLANKGKRLSQETIDKIIQKTTGQKRTEETKRKISLANKGRVYSEEVRERMKLNREMKKSLSKSSTYQQVQEVFQEFKTVFENDYSAWGFEIGAGPLEYNEYGKPKHQEKSEYQDFAIHIFIDNDEFREKIPTSFKNIPVMVFVTNDSSLSNKIEGIHFKSIK